MANYKEALQGNNTDLQGILDVVNALPVASGGAGVEERDLTVQVWLGAEYAQSRSGSVLKAYRIGNLCIVDIVLKLNDMTLSNPTIEIRNLFETTSDILNSGFPVTTRSNYSVYNGIVASYSVTEPPFGDIVNGVDINLGQSVSCSTLYPLIIQFMYPCVE